MDKIKKAQEIIKAAVVKIAMPLTYKSSKPGEYRDVYRMHDGAGLGPYSSPGSWEDIDDYEEFLKLDSSKNNPLPADDAGFDDHERTLSKNDQLGDYLFGFADMSQYQTWWTPRQRDLLTSNGFSLHKEKATEIRDSGKQIFYIPYVDSK